MKKSVSRQLAATLVLAASATMTASIAQEAPAQQAGQAQQAQGNQAPAASPIPPKPYTMPTRGIPKHIQEAVQSPNRTPELKEMDGWNRPAEILALSGVRKGARVIEFGPYDHYYTEMLLEAIGPKGELYIYEVPDIDEQVGERNREFAAKHPNVTYSGADYNTLEFPRQVDLVFNNLYFHEMLLRGTQLEPLHSKLFKAMKPGAIYLAIDHTAVLGTETNHTGTLHRIDPSIMRAHIGAGGFEMVEDSRLLENHSDDRTWPAFEPGKRVQTDRTVYKFRKPIVY